MITQGRGSRNADLHNDSWIWSADELRMLARRWQEGIAEGRYDDRRPYGSTGGTELDNARVQIALYERMAEYMDTHPDATKRQLKAAWKAAGVRS